MLLEPEEVDSMGKVQKTGCPIRNALSPSRLLLVVILYSQPIPNRVETFVLHLQYFLSTCSVEGS